MSEISSNLNLLKSRIPESVKIVAVSKTKPPEDILQAYQTGQRLFGENRVQEILSKKDMLPSDIEWHMIGHLQTNKVKSVVPFISMIQSVDTMKLLKVINAEAVKIGRTIDCLLEIFIATEETKSGFSVEELIESLGSEDLSGFPGVKVCGVMGMASFTEDTGQVRREFKYLYDTFKMLKDKFFRDDTNFREISMGMSGDYHIAVEEGSTIIRVGGLIFGERNKN